MSDSIRLCDRPELLADIDAATGDLVRLHDRRLRHAFTGHVMEVEQHAEWGPVLSLAGGTAYHLEG